LALARAGSSIAAKMAMMAMTTKSSIKVKPEYDRIPTACLFATSLLICFWFKLIPVHRSKLQGVPANQLPAPGWLDKSSQTKHQGLRSR
jgi:hypothetical protein